MTQSSTARPIPLRQPAQQTSNALEAFYAAYITTNMMVREMDRLIDQQWKGLTTVQALVMKSLLEGASQPNQVAASLSQQSQTVTGVLDRLEKVGYIRRMRNLPDRRAVKLEVTQAFLYTVGGKDAFLTKLVDIAKTARKAVEG